MSQQYIVIDDFGSTAHKFSDQKNYIKNIVKGFTFSPSAWKEIEAELIKQGKRIDPLETMFLGKPVHIVELQKYKCLGWIDEKYMNMYIKVSQIRRETLKSAINNMSNKLKLN